MTSARSKWAVACALAFVTAVTLLYTAGLRESPPYLMHDELQFSLQAQSIATTGRDLAGRRFPVFFTEPEFPAGRDPVIIYATAALLQVVPFSEHGVRLPTAILGVINVVLMFFVGRALFGSGWGGLLAAALLALTPIHFIRSRLVLSPFYSIPIVLLWLATLTGFESGVSVKRLLAAGAWLGLGVYTYLACVVMMPLYLAATCLWASRAGRARGAIMAVGAFVVVLLPMLAWYATHPERVAQVIGSYQLYSGAPQRSLLEQLQTRIATYWSFFNPEFLFISGDTSLINSTRLVGFYPMAFAILIPAGLYAIWKSSRPLYWMIGLGFVTAPVASVISGAVEMNRIMFAIPFGVLVAAVGGWSWLESRGWPRIGFVIVLVSVPIQFATFHADYFGHYRVRASYWFGGNLRDAVTEVIGAEPLAAGRPVYISEKIPFAARYWRFYAIKANRADLIDRAFYYGDPPVDAPAGARLICQTATTECQSLATSDRWQRVATGIEPDPAALFDVYERRPAF